MTDTASDHRRKLIQTLQMAYSGEKAAGTAYNGHWRSLKLESEQIEVRTIEEQEWAHRELVGKMLQSLNAAPQFWREIMMTCIGNTVSFACYFIGWFMPMYFAGRLESANIEEYERASAHATALGLHEFASSLSELADVEAEHELYFMRKVVGHKWLPLFRQVFPWQPYRANWLLTEHSFSTVKVDAKN
jgi:demethoxyubiquinone hydroxylase (CLK1/Coq7/Cat5 family)